MRFQPEPSWQLAVSGEGIDPGVLWPDWPGDLSFSAKSTGSLQEGRPAGLVHVERIGGQLRGSPVRGKAEIRLAEDEAEIPAAELFWGSARMRIEGSVGQGWDLAWNLRAPALGDLLPESAGSLLSTGSVTGSRQTPSVRLRAEGEGLRFGDRSLARLEAEVEAGLEPGAPLDVRAELGSLEFDGFEAREARLRAGGSLEAHRIEAELRSPQVDLQTELEGSYGANAWQGFLNGLAAKPAGSPSWDLVERTSVRVEERRLDMAPLCLRSKNAELCLEAGLEEETWKAAARGKRLPLDLLSDFLPTGLGLEGTIDLSGQAGGSGGLWNVEAELTPSAAAVVLSPEEGETVRLRIEDGSVDLRADPSAAKARFRVGFGGGDLEGGSLQGGIGLGLDTSEPRPLSGRIEGRLPSLAVFAPLLPDVGELEGVTEVDLALAGTAERPLLDGFVRLSGGGAVIPELGIRIEQAEASLEAAGTDRLRITGSAASGGGRLKIEGEATLALTDARLEIRGESFQAARRTDLELTVSPDLRIDATEDRIRIDGVVRVPSAWLQLDAGLPAVGTSEDAVVVGRAEETAAPLPIEARVRLELGDDVRATGLGAELRLAGDLDLVDDPERTTLATGELVVREGTYKAFGQTLEIRESRVLYAGGPVSEPAIDFRAERETRDGTVAGLHATGRASSPEIEVYTVPATSPSDAISYLVLGRPLEGASRSDGELLQGAIAALGLKRGNLLAAGVGRRLGLDVAEIEVGRELEDAALFLGKYLSPKIYVAYGVGLFRPIGTFRARYLLGKGWELRAESSDEAGVDLTYRPKK